MVCGPRRWDGGTCRVASQHRSRGLQREASPSRSRWSACRLLNSVRERTLRKSAPGDQAARTQILARTSLRPGQHHHLPALQAAPWPGLRPAAPALALVRRQRHGVARAGTKMANVSSRRRGCRARRGNQPSRTQILARTSLRPGQHHHLPALQAAPWPGLRPAAPALALVRRQRHGVARAGTEMANVSSRRRGRRARRGNQPPRTQVLARTSLRPGQHHHPPVPQTAPWPGLRPAAPALALVRRQRHDVARAGTEMANVGSRRRGRRARRGNQPPRTQVLARTSLRPGQHHHPPVPQTAPWPGLRPAAPAQALVRRQGHDVARTRTEMARSRSLRHCGRGRRESKAPRQQEDPSATLHPKHRSPRRVGKQAGDGS
jgi:hypothetical protein